MAGPTIHNLRIQRPVGQGFFHTASLLVGSERFRYIYDCGSENRDVLLHQIATYLSNSPLEAWDAQHRVDSLFVSHLDLDHVNGLDVLLARVTVDTVVLPYLSPFERLAAAAEALRHEIPPVTFLQLWADPARWFGERGVRRIIQILGDSGPESPLPELPVETTFAAEGVIHMDIRPLTGAALRRSAYRIHARPVEALVVPHFLPLTLVSGAGTLNWIFLTFVHPEPGREEVFRRAVKRAFRGTQGLPRSQYSRLDIEWVLAVMRDPKLRDQLAECYETIRHDRNLTSMSLYSGPVKTNDVIQMRWQGSQDERFRPYSFGVSGWNVGWLATGDANLQRLPRRRHFRDHFRAIEPSLLTMALPHHGARGSFHLELLEMANLYFVAAGSQNRHGHPHPEVSESLAAAKGSLFVVNEQPWSELSESVTIWPRGK
jgi:hypothetical protein